MPAVAAARQLQQHCAARKTALVAQGFDPAVLGIGVGIHTGITSFGEFGPGAEACGGCRLLGRSAIRDN
jgi:hypothetical protein